MSIRIAPRSAPTMVPAPPRMLTPPTTAAATDSSSSPRPAVALIVPDPAPRYRKPASPASAPHPTNDQNTIVRRVDPPG